MKLNFKALVVSLVLCSAQFSILPVYNNSVLAMNPYKDPIVNKNGITVFRCKGITYSINSTGSTLVIHKCPKNVLRREVLCTVLNNIHKRGFDPEWLIIGKSIESIVHNAFGDTQPLVRTNQHKVIKPSPSLGRINKIVVNEDTVLDRKMKSDIHYYNMCKNLELLIKKLEFYRLTESGPILYDFDFDINWYPKSSTSKVSRGIYKHWTQREFDLLDKISKQANSEEELYRLAIQNGIESTKYSIVAAARSLGWRAQK